MVGRVLRGAAVPAALYSVWVAVCIGAGLRMRIPWEFHQLLGREWLAERPLESLLLLHSQPPLLNAMLAGLLRTSAASGLAVETLARAMFAGFGLLAAVLLHRIVLALTRSRLAAGIAVVLALADPAFHVFGCLFFYEFPLHALMLLVIWAAVGYLRRGQRGWLVLLVGALATVSNLRTLFGPPWAVAVFLIVVWLRRRMERAAGSRVRMPEGAATAAVVLASMLALWPLKNYVVFGRFIYSSWTGFNLCRGTGLEDSRLERFLETGEAPAEPAGGPSISWCCFASESPVLKSPTKGRGVRNWNHAVFLALDGELRWRGLQHRLERPGRWLDKCKSYYLRWGRASFVSSYSEELFISGARPAVWYEAYAELWRDWLHFDIRPGLRKLLGRETADASAEAELTPWPVYSIAFLPAVLGTAVYSVVRRRRKVGWRFGAYVVLVFMIVWPMAAACLSDGAEGNRMRFSSNGLMIVLLTVMWRFRRWRRPSHPGMRRA